MTCAQDYLETMRLLPPSRGGSVGTGSRDAEKSVKVDAHEVSVALVLIALGFMYSVHNLIAPNMTAIAKLFHFNEYERDAYLGGELTLVFYFPGVLGALFAGVFSALLERRILLVALAFLTSVTCLFTTWVSSFGELAWARATTGFAIGGSLPIVYSLIGDWFPAERRASATACVSAATGAGVFLGQCVATLMGSVDWRFPFVVVALPTAVAGALLLVSAEEPVRGGQEDGVEALSLCRHNGYTYMPVFSSRQMRTLLHNKTNVLVILQAFPGNIPWGVIIVYLHDFLVQDIGMARHNALCAITFMAVAAFAGVIMGGFIGEALYKSNKRHLVMFAGVCNIVRAFPFFVVFGWSRMFGPLEKTSEGTFFVILMAGGFVATMASPCTGAMLLNVNLPETRGTLVAMYSVLDDVSKGFGTLFVSVLVHLVGGRAVAYQLSLLLWVIIGAALLTSTNTYEEDEQNMRKNLDESAMESMVLLSKQRAQRAVRDRARAAGEAHRDGAAFMMAQHRGGMLPAPLRFQHYEGCSAWSNVQTLLPSLSGVWGAAAAPEGSASRGCRSALDASTAAGAAPLAARAKAPTASGGGFTSNFGSVGGVGGVTLERERRHQAVRAAAQAAGSVLPR
mmetsp:Transcript_78700/g.218624  ORF Transcript_78700/g.218624 Transcript_78700/m.218624 type:complete len:623 (-) Transcript_78700:148-2016(-)|eukprot:CAMPEP_0117520302 /NCGR_PEP_ID=MMETSP0784-20121206/33100_1 /TAXON_ID=39447 /ORGANISM="" /LENGTH=622 /DNA_ID=CAMNT_0005316295 /DNA_START=117 /DNA_END=1985 /DNA_ORIENTATION=-